MDDFLDSIGHCTDYEEVLADLLDRACAVGMPPDTFWGLEPADAIAYVSAREEQIYNNNVELAQMIVGVLGNSMSKHPKKKPLPTYDELLQAAARKEADKHMTGEERLERRVADIRAMFAQKQKQK